MRILFTTLLLLVTMSVFAQNIGDCVKTVYYPPVAVQGFKVVELEPAIYETYIKTPAVSSTVRTEAVYEWRTKEILVKSAHTDYVKSNCGTDAGCSWKKVAVPAVYKTIRYKVLVKDACVTTVVTIPAVLGRRLVRPAITSKVRTETITEGGKIVLQSCN